MSSLDYLKAAVVGANKATASGPTSSYYPPKKVEEPLVVVEDPVVVTEEFEVDSPAVEETSYARSGDHRKYTGPFARIEFASKDKEDDFWQVFVVAAGPSGLCNFALTCTYFYDKLLAPDVWALVEPQLGLITPQINFLVETAVENAGGVQEKLITVNVTSLKQNYQYQHLVNHWLRILSKAEAELEKSKSGDPTNSELNAVLNGGFSIETGTAKNSQQIFYLQDLSLVPSVLENIKKLISIQKLQDLQDPKKRTAKISYRNGSIILSRYGRGGHFLSLHVKLGKENIFSVFPLDEFANQIRKAAKKYIPLVGSCLVQLKKKKNIPSSELTSFPKKEEWIKKVLNHDKLHLETTQIRSKLASGVVPGSLLPAHFQKKRISDQKKQDQTEIENANIMDLILENLPEHWQEAKIAARHLEDYVKEERENEKTERRERKQRERQERIDRERAQKEAEEQAKLNIEIKEDEPQESIPKKAKTTKVISKDNDGWVHQKVLDDEGNELEKPKPEVLSKSKKGAAVTATSSVKPDRVDPTRNLYDINQEDEEDLPTKAEYIASVKDQKLKGKQEKSEKSEKSKKEKPKPVPKPKIENKEIEKESEKKLKKAPKSESKKPPQKVVVADVPFWQNELFKPLAYVFGIVSVVSFLYLVLN